MVVESDLPDASWILAPSVNGHERPVDEALLGVIALSLRQQHRVGAHWRAHVDVQIASTRIFDGHVQLHVLQVADVIVLLAHATGRFDVDLDWITRTQITNNNLTC